MSFVTRSGNQFMHDGRRLRGIMFNFYPFIIGMTAQATVQQLADDAAAIGSPGFRTWSFDAGSPPSNSNGNIRYLDYPLGTNLIANPSFENDASGYTLGSGWTRVMEGGHAGPWAIKQVTGSGFAELTSDPHTVTQNTDYVYTFWSYVDVLSGPAPVTFIKGVQTGSTLKDAGFTDDTAGDWKRKQVIFNSGANTTIQIRHLNWNGNVVAYYDDFNLSVKTTPVLSVFEPTLQQLDMVLDELGKRGLKLILSLADNPTYLTKLTYVTWANEIYGAGLSTAYPYVGFYNSPYCRQLYKDFVTLLANRYRNDDRIFSIELGNELRYDVFDSEGGTQNTAGSQNIAKMKDWIEDVGAHIKTEFPNHLLGFSSVSHTYQWVSGDTVSNGSGYGVDYNIYGTISVLDYLSFHCYPTQGGGEVNLLPYGQRLGHPTTPTGAGFRAQIRDVVSSIKGNAKPVMNGEVGLIREVFADTSKYPLAPRHNFFREYLRDFFNASGDIVIPWSATHTGGGSYSIGLADTGGENTFDNSNDQKLVSLFAQYNFQFRHGGRTPIERITGIAP